MPSEEGQLQSSRPALTDRRSSSSRLHRQTDASSDSTANSPPSTIHKSKSTTRAHVVGGRMHKRVPSYGTNLHKHTKPHTADAHSSSKTPRRPHSPGPSASPPPTENMPHVSSDVKLPRNGSTTSLKKNSSNVSLKRNRSTAEINKRPKSSSGLKRTLSQPGLKKKDLRRASVHFDIGNDANEDGWTEASNSASPSLSRTNSVAGQSSGQNSARPHASANVSEAPTPAEESPHTSSDQSHQSNHHRTITPDARQITDRLLQRTPSHSAAPQMSSIIATATATSGSPDPFGRSAATAPGTPANSASKDEITSRFVGSTAGTPTAGDNSPFLTNRTSDRNDSKADINTAKRVKSMGNLNRQDTDFDGDEERALAPRARQGSTASTYNPNVQSRTQQKLWLQRASSNIEPQSGIPNGNTLVGAVYEGRDPRVRVQLERTGLEYLVVRRYQDPVGMAIKRLAHLPGVDKSRLIPPQKGHQRNGSGSIGAGKHGLSQSLRESREGRATKSSAASVRTNGARSSYEASQQDSESDKEDNDIVEALLRRLWDKNLLESGSVE